MPFVHSHCWCEPSRIRNQQHFTMLHKQFFFVVAIIVGVIVCGRAAFAEICDDTNQALGVSLVFAAWNSAIVLGPALGGKKMCYIII